MEKLFVHTDEVAKLLSLMINFPENQEKEKNYHLYTLIGNVNIPIF